MQTDGNGGALLIATDRFCRYCNEKLHPEASVCRVCLKYQNAFVEVFSKLAGLGTIASALISLCLLGLTYAQLRDASDLPRKPHPFIAGVFSCSANSLGVR